MLPLKWTRLNKKKIGMLNVFIQECHKNGMISKSHGKTNHLQKYQYQDRTAKPKGNGGMWRL